MASPAFPMLQDLRAPVLDNGANEKRSAPVTLDEGSKEIMAVEEAVSSLTNKDTGPQPVTKAMRRKASIQFATLCWSIFVVGWNDGTTGPLVPRLQEVYHVCDISVHLVSGCVAYQTPTLQVSYAVVSLIFIASCVVRPPVSRSRFLIYKSLTICSHIYISGFHLRGFLVHLP